MSPRRFRRAPELFVQRDRHRGQLFQHVGERCGARRGTSRARHPGTQGWSLVVSARRPSARVVLRMADPPSPTRELDSVQYEPGDGWWLLAVIGSIVSVILAIVLEVVGGSFANSPVPEWAHIVPITWPSGLRVLWWVGVGRRPVCSGSVCTVSARGSVRWSFPRRCSRSSSSPSASPSVRTGPPGTEPARTGSGTAVDARRPRP